MQVLVHKNQGDFMGKMLEVEIISAGKHFLVGRVVKDSDVSSPGLVEPLPKGVVSGIAANCTQSRTDKRVESNRIWLNIALVVLFVAVLMRICQLSFLWIKR